MRDYFQFVHPLNLLTLSWISFPAFRTFSVDYDSCAGPVRTEYPVVQAVGVILIHRLGGLKIQGRAAFHTEAARRRYDGTALGTGLTGDFFVTMRAFHNDSQLFEEVTVWKAVIFCLTFTLLHLGHLNFVFSYSAILIVSEKFFLHFSHLKSYTGMIHLRF